MSDDHIATLIKLSDSGLMLADPAEDVRGRTVRDSDGEEIGTVEDLLIDSGEAKVRFLLVEHGGILGIGAKPSYVPVEAISTITEDEIRLSHSRQRVSESPRYDPELADESKYYADLYGYYGYAPFWGGPGYMGSVYPPPRRAPR